MKQCRQIFLPNPWQGRLWPPHVSLSPPPSSSQLPHSCLPLPSVDRIVITFFSLCPFHACIWKSISLHAGVCTCDCLPPRSMDAPPGQSHEGPSISCFPRVWCEATSIYCMNYPHHKNVTLDLWPFLGSVQTASSRANSFRKVI